MFPLRDVRHEVAHIADHGGFERLTAPEDSVADRGVSPALLKEGKGWI